jgi:hypothetical protein
MSRRSRITRLAATLSVLTLAAGCGVQSTGVNVADTHPISASSPSAVASSPRGAYPVHIFLVQQGTQQLVPVTRWLDDPPTDQSILAELRKPLTADEQSSGFDNLVPSNLYLQPTQKQARQYSFSGVLDRQWTVSARLQVICTLDVYWLLNFKPGYTASTELIVNGIDSTFDDCQRYAPYAASLPFDGTGSGPVPGYPGAVTAAPSDQLTPNTSSVKKP